MSAFLTFRDLDGQALLPHLPGVSRLHVNKKKMMVTVIKSEKGYSTTGNSLISVLNVAVLELSVGICASGNHL